MHITASGMDPGFMQRQETPVYQCLRCLHNAGLITNGSARHHAANAAKSRLDTTVYLGIVTCSSESAHLAVHPLNRTAILHHRRPPLSLL